MLPEVMDLDEAHSPEQTSQVHSHRVQNTQSKLPAFRFVDLHRRNSLPVQPASIRHDSASKDQHIDIAPIPTKQGDSNNNPSPLSSSRTASGHSSASTTIVHPQNGSVDSSGPGTGPLSSLTGGPGSAQRAETCNTGIPSPHKASSPHILQENRRPRPRRAPASYSSNGLETKSGPPPALSSLRSYQLDLSQKPPEQSTSEWAQQQQQLLAPSQIQNNENTRPERGQLRPSTSSGARIRPIRNFTSSSARSSVGMSSSRGSYYRYESPEDEEMDGDDREQTLRALQGYPIPQRPGASRRESAASKKDEAMEEQSTPPRTGDLFLDLALENLEVDKNAKRNSATERMSRIALPTNRSSLPNPTTSTATANAMNKSFDRDSVPSPYARGSAEHSTPPSSITEDRFAYDKAAAHSRATSIPQTHADITKSRYPPSANRSNPTTPRVFNYRDASYESTSSATSNRNSAPSVAGSSRAHAYKQSNLSSFSTPRMYNFSSPSIPRSAELGHSDDGTISTTAPSTVWDELDDLKSRIKKLELTGRLPSTSGLTIRPSGERPPTATTTATTMSTSPKRGRQISGAYSEDQGEYNHEEAHPLLHAALAKSRTILNTEIYKALENTAQDALGVASMVGSDGRQGYISSGASVVGGPGGSIADRQLRRKADSMCRSLTELCIALSDSPQSSPGTAGTARPTSRGKELALQLQSASERERELKRSETAAGIMQRVKQSPQAPSRALSRLEARRNSLLRDTPPISPRFEPGASLSTPGSASAAAGRRTSLLLGRSRGGTEERGLEDSRMEDVDLSYRGPSRANTEVGRGSGGISPRKRAERLRPAIRERTPVYSSLMTDREREREAERIEQETRERERPVSTVSQLPVRRTYTTNSPSAQASRRRYLDRERETGSVMERLALDRHNLSRLQNLEAVGVNRTRSLGGASGAVGRLRAGSHGVGREGAGIDGEDTINSTRAETGGYNLTRSFGL